MIYLTFGDQYSGVISSQVADVCQYLQETFGVKVRLISFISVRGFWGQRKKFKAAYSNVWVLPMVPRLRNWRINIVLLGIAALFSGNQIAMCRGVLAINLVLMLKKWRLLRFACFDARGAYAAEWTEYEVVSDQRLIKAVPHLESKAVNNSDMRLAVSQKLVNLWNQAYGYSDEKHVIIPCTINSYFDQKIPTPELIAEIRQQFGFQANDIILVYSGSSAGWQSMQLLDDFFGRLLAKNPAVRILLMAKWDLEQLKSWHAYPARIQKEWVSHEAVFDVLAMCDYGLLIRGDSITNQVAAPTKFGEYLAAGLRVLITDNIGDYPDFVRQFGVGYVIKDNPGIPLENTSYEEKTRINQLARTHFTKEAFQTAYGKILKSLHSK